MITHLQNDRHAHEIYDHENIQNNTGVQNRYKQHVLTYYGKQGSLKGKRDWITDKLHKELSS